MRDFIEEQERNEVGKSVASKLESINRAMIQLRETSNQLRKDRSTIVAGLETGKFEREDLKRLHASMDAFGRNLLRAARELKDFVGGEVTIKIGGTDLD